MLSERYIRYAFLMYCDRQNLDRETFNDEMIEKMQGTIAAAVGGGIAAAPIHAIFGSADGGGGGFCVG